MGASELLVIVGASGVWKSPAALALHELLVAQSVQHAAVEGDALDLAYPAPWKTGLAFKNLAAIWANYKVFGHHRLIFTNTVFVLEVVAITKAMGDDPRVTAVLLQVTLARSTIDSGRGSTATASTSMRRRAGMPPCASTWCWVSCASPRH